MTKDKQGRNTIPAVVINLDRHHDRLAWLSENAHAVQLPFERIVAVDAKDESLLGQIEAIRSPSFRLSYAEAACILSHRKAWKYLLDHDDSHLAVFEDDLHFSKDLPHLLDTGLIPANANLIKLEVPSGKVSYAQKSSANYLGRRLHRLITKAYGAGAYIISRRCARRLLEISEHCEEPVDVILFDEKSPIWGEFGALQVIPAPCIQDVNLCRLTSATRQFESAIESERLEAKGIRKQLNQKNKKSIPLKKLRRYLACVYQGANPFRHKGHVALDLGHPTLSPSDNGQ